MIKLTEVENNIQAQFILDHLKAAGIKCFINGQFIQGAIGELPALTGPVIWIEDESDYEQAMVIQNNLRSDPEKSQFYNDAWLCPECRENLEPAFTQCWQCGFIRPHQGQPENL